MWDVSGDDHDLFGNSSTSLPTALLCVCEVILSPRTEHGEPERLELISEFSWPAQGGAVAAVDLIWNEPETVTYDRAQPGRGEQPIVATQYEPSRHVWPGSKWPRLLPRRAGLFATSGERLSRKVGWHVV